MKITALRFLLSIIVGVALVGCAPTMYVETGGNSSGLNKSALHYIVPPSATDSAETKNLYPVVVNAFQINHIALTQNKKDAAFLVTWGTESQSRQVHTVDAIPTSGGWNSLNVNSYSYGNGINGISPTGPQYVSVVRSYHMQNFTINIWKHEPLGSHPAGPVWSGSATAGAGDVKNPAPIVNEIVARYGTNFQGNSEIKSN